MGIWGESHVVMTPLGAFHPTGILLKILDDTLRQPPKATRSSRFADTVTVLVEEISIHMMIDVCTIGTHIHRFSSIAWRKKKGLELEAI